MALFGDRGSIEELELTKEREQVKLDIEEIRERRVAAARAQKAYGKDWTKMFSNFGGGIDWQKLKFQTGVSRQ